ncbi:gamma-secretase subunit [Perilla frutescens var. hirtella]|uniref:Gamma-secretase subunit n=1 Tax=Perilla frutescens var. hirtella TaxID=608512 RepID=A0AAD4JHD8_PERFH|nr:gamma-secretase subunit [Perilla frutescens var. frutescens]KAH6800843.1 gamma-secretase subunit [Perilla frutescens var. hirtella]KAH6833344.1 gamma-secretase subunit [Perilla frutescens var. hirtella]
MDNDSRSPFSNRHPTAAASVLPTTVATDEASSSTRRLGRTEYTTIDGPLGLSPDDSLTYARRFFKLGFLCLPFLWAVNCFYFWPVLRHHQFQQSHPRLRRYLVGSAIGFFLFTTILSSWALTFAIGGEHLFGHVWGELVMYNVAEKYGLTGWI